MDELIRQFDYTFNLRPYFFVFFAVYLLGCSLHIGVKRTMLFTPAGFAVAWAAEYSSIHTGFPFGYYRYTGLTKGLELWVLDVPFIDSASFVFLAWASYSTALTIVYAPFFASKDTRSVAVENARPLHVWLVATLLFVLLDIIIDPLALRGDRWFLGKFYYYPEPGFYFGVPLANFGGWLLVGFVLVWLLHVIDPSADRKGRWKSYRPLWRHSLGPSLYCSIFGFNLFITFFIGEHLMGWVGVLLFLFVLALAASWWRHVRQRCFAPG